MSFHASKHIIQTDLAEQTEKAIETYGNFVVLGELIDTFVEGHNITPEFRRLWRKRNAFISHKRIIQSQISKAKAKLNNIKLSQKLEVMLGDITSSLDNEKEQIKTTKMEIEELLQSDDLADLIREPYDDSTSCSN